VNFVSQVHVTPKLQYCASQTMSELYLCRVVTLLHSSVISSWPLDYVEGGGGS
jgi:hypothetical protein